MAAASCAHIWPYCASVAAIAGPFCPSRCVATSDANCVRLAAITGGGTVIANAASYADAAAIAWFAVCSASAAVVFIHGVYRAATAGIAVDAPPRQPSPVRLDTIEV